MYYTDGASGIGGMARNTGYSDSHKIIGPKEKEYLAFNQNAGQSDGAVGLKNDLSDISIFNVKPPGSETS